MKKTSISALLLAMLLFLSSCIITLPAPPSQTPPEQNDPSSGGDDPIKDSEIKNDPESWGSSSAVTVSTKHITVMMCKTADLKNLVGAEFDISTATWQSACEGIATVDGGIVTGVKCGRTDITANDSLGNTALITVTVEFLISENNGYNFNSKKDTAVYKVADEYEASRLIDKAIASHTSEIVLDFSALGSSYVAFRDFDVEVEFGNHISLSKRYYDNEPHILYVTIQYEKDAASAYIDQTPDNTYSAIANGNMVIRMDRLAESEHKRSDDFEGFAINTVNNGTFKVYNSEELWWALEHNYKPEFAFANSKAELFYERAKMILRDIITEDMDELDKVIAIAEYLTDAVAYDYDAFYNASRPENDSTTNVCYYLEGVFERGIAVCDGKSKAFVLFCRIEGIECVRDFGTDPAGGAGHAWNYVKLGEDWYMVDTTGTDNSSGANTNIGQYYGNNIEYMIYTPLLTGVFYHSEAYNYSGIFSEITDTASGKSITDEVFANKIYGTQYDFYIEAKLELENITALLLESELCDDAILSFRTELTNDIIFEAVGTAINKKDSNADIRLITFGEGEEKFFALLLKGMGM